MTVVALRTHPRVQRVGGLKGLTWYKDKIKERMKEKTHEQLGSKTTMATVPLQRRQKCMLVFLNSYREIRKRMEIPL